jgi:uncharacterized protein
MSTPAVLIATVRVRSGQNQAYVAWQARHHSVISKFPGFISCDTLRSTKPGSDEWTIVMNFRSQDDLVAWQNSKEQAELVAQAAPFFEGGNLSGVMEQSGDNVTEIIISRIKPGMDEVYREWAVRIQAAQAGYPGYRGTYLQPPSSGEGSHWTTFIRYDTAAHLEAWMNAPERAKLLEESKTFIEKEELSRLATAFPGWVPINPETGKGPPDWKTAQLVLLGLFPVVMLEMRFLNPLLHGLNSSFATFIGNALSVAATSFITMPLFVRCFNWWLFPKEGSGPAVTLKGVAILIILFALEVALLWRLLPG